MTGTGKCGYIVLFHIKGDIRHGLSAVGYEFYIVFFCDLTYLFYIANRTRNVARAAEYKVVEIVRYCLGIQYSNAPVFVLRQNFKSDFFLVF